VTDRLRCAVLVSGRGSNLRALLEAIDRGECRARVAGVIADRPRCAALELARERSLPVRVVPPSEHPDRAAWDAALADTIAALEPELVMLAGFMRIVGDRVLARFCGRIVNVHPSLLPSFPGMDAPRQAIEARARISGCTVHLVDAGVDTGPILAQAALRVHESDDAASLHARIQALEHALLPRVVDWIATGALALDPPRFTGPERDDALFSPPVET
jgi:phosphoribosylglycinamide formyltransferase-1